MAEHSSPPIMERATGGAVWFADPALGTVEVTGRERVSWLNGLVTCDVTKVARGVAQYGLAVVKVGRILTDLFVVEAQDRLLVAMPRERIAAVREHLERYLIMEDAAHENVSDAWAWIRGHGPLAAALAAEVATAHGGFSGSVDVTGLGGAVLCVPAGSIPSALATLGAAENSSIGTEAEWDALRIERGLAQFGVDFDEQTYPQEASLEKTAVSFNKGCYLGQEVVCRLEMRGHVSRKIVPLRIEGTSVPAKGAEVRADGRSVGTITSAAAAGGSVFALAMLRFAYAEIGRDVEVEGLPARVVG